MIKIQPIVYDILMSEPEASYALTHDFMNMSGYANKIRNEVEKKTKKSVTRISLVISLSRIRNKLKKTKSLIQKIKINNITTKLPLSEIVYDNTDISILKLESLHRKIKIPQKDFFTSTIGTNEIIIICSSNTVKKITEHFKSKPKLIDHRLAAIAISFNANYSKIPNVIFSLVSKVARTKINILEIVSTYTELIFIVAEEDFSEMVSLFSKS